MDAKTQADNASSSVRTPPKPRCALEVAVVGNRRFAKETDAAPNPAADAMKQRAQDACGHVWRVIRNAMFSALDLRVPLTAPLPSGGSVPRTLYQRDFFTVEPPRLGVLTALAAGADQFAAQAALTLQVPIRTGTLPAIPPDTRAFAVELEAVMPFPEADYPGTAGQCRAEFRPEEAETLRDLARSSAQTVRLDGRYHVNLSLEPDASPNRAARHLAYRQVQDLLLENADLLLAVYDPQAQAGEAGTREVVKEALGRGLPVVAVLVRPREVRIALYASPPNLPEQPEAEWNTAWPLDDAAWGEQLTARVKYLLAIPHLLAPEEPEPPAKAERRQHLLAETVTRLRIFYGEAPIAPLCLCPVRGELLAQTWQWTLKLGQRLASSHKHLAEEQPARGRDRRLLPPYQAFYDRASEVSEHYMRTYRGAFVLAYVLAGFAVAVAVALLTAALVSGGRTPLWAVWTFGLAKLIALFTLLWLVASGRQHRYQEQAADFRSLAELLRPVGWLARLGASVPAVDLPVHYTADDPRQGWMQWLFRAVARGTPSFVLPGTPQTISLTGADAAAALAAASEEWVQSQIHYHWGNAIRMHRLEDGLERLAKVLLFAVLGCALADVILELLLHQIPTLPGAALAHGTAVACGALAAMLPAFIAALAGILFQSEAKRLRLRSEAMYESLKLQQKVLTDECARIQERPAAQGGEVWAAAQRLRKLASLMLAETGDWRALYPLHEVKAG